MQDPVTIESSSKDLPAEVMLGWRLEDEGRESHSSPVTAGQTKMPSVRPQMFRKKGDGGRKEAKRLVGKAENKWQETSVLRG